MQSACATHQIDLHYIGMCAILCQTVSDKVMIFLRVCHILVYVLYFVISTIRQI